MLSLPQGIDDGELPVLGGVRLGIGSSWRPVSMAGAGLPHVPPVNQFLPARRPPLGHHVLEKGMLADKREHGSVETAGLTRIAHRTGTREKAPYTDPAALKMPVTAAARLARLSDRLSIC